jgi:DNA segregation ATPase FtsK/SpoIIIE-like protein
VIEKDPLIEQAKKVSRKVGYVSVSYLQRNMRIGYTRAASLVDKLIEEGFCEKEPTAWRYDVTAEHNAHLTPETGATSQAVVNASALEQPDGDTPPAQAQVA